LKLVAIIPVREFKNTKLRLRSVLSESERSALTKSLLNHVLAQLQESQIDKVVIIASDKRSASSIARGFSKAVIIRESKHHGGVNYAMEDGMMYWRTHFGDATSFMLIPSDLPLLSSEAINEAISKLDYNNLVISPSIKRDGTNLLLFNFPAGKIPLHYDDDSYKQHLKEAKKLNGRYSIFRKKEFLSDLDSISDLQKIMRTLEAKSLQNLFSKLVS
jgi:2-phospho-L-lactate guanylyltransferase